MPQPILLAIPLAGPAGRAPEIWQAVGWVLGLLAAGSLLRVAGLLRGGAWRPERLKSLFTWWASAALLVVVAATGLPGLFIACGAISCLALLEYLRWPHPAAPPQHARWLSFALLPLHYGLLAALPPGPALAVLPAAAPLLLLAGAVMSGTPRHALATTGTLLLGLALCVYLPSLLLVLPEGAAGRAAADPLAAPLVAILLTEGHDIAAALGGRRLGGRRVLPRISPNKTWSGVACGLFAALALGAWFGPLLMPMGPLAGAGAGAVAAAGAFYGDAGISALKRDLGIKESGRLLPGQGGLLDRIDSLIATVPLLLLYFATLPGR